MYEYFSVNSALTSYIDTFGGLNDLFSSTQGLRMNISQTTFNSTSVDDSGPSISAFDYLCASVYAAIIVAAIVGNFLACLAFILSGIVRACPTNHFIVSLAVSDLLTTCLAMTFDMEQLLTNQHWSHGEALCQVWTSIYLITVPSSLWSLFVLSVDRYKTLKDPLNRFRQSPFMTRRRAEMVIVGLWAYSGMFALMPVMGWKPRAESVYDGGCYFNIAPEYSLLTSFINFLLPTLLMCALYWRIYRVANAVTKNKLLYDTTDRPTHIANQIADKNLKKKMKTTKNILMVACACFFCWMPYTVLSITITIMILLCLDCRPKLPSELGVLLLILGYSSSALNPYLYALRNRKFRRALNKILRAFRGKGTHRNNSSRSAALDSSRIRSH